ncbi:molybdate ABC transporter substrate-binding protein [Hoeflea olei]|uniref:Molybdenum ABC transporter substrate-binding protein n=1 Tax=Hoeflea olei TaxID=1480615 RepID=A0A1C1YWD3_9HYPH|nr:molybdate ABC transporter substrate-binding protein [Hoeflea olei]OCW57818.1 molybdenum ABC transporter substrate-binding protein [Hoeflea olei]
MFALTRRATVAAALVLASTLALPAAQAEEVTVFAAASMKTALDEVAADWQAETGNTAVISYAGSSALARQIQEGAPADLFISAAVNWMDTLEEAKLIKSETRVDLLGNTLVLIGHGADAADVEIAPGFDLAGLLGDNRLAMALVDSVPAGVYGKAALTSLGVWDAVEPKVAQADNVRAALQLVATGEAPMGIVYATDAAAEPDVRVVATFPADSHPAIIYPAAVTAESAKPEAEAFLEYLSGAKARSAFEAQGFTVLKK